jgi:hypothetical protein
VAGGFSQKRGIDYDKILVPIARLLPSGSVSCRSSWLETSPVDFSQIMYLVHTGPDIYYAVNALIQFMCEPKHIHMVAVKHILRYVRGTIAYGL